MNNDVDPFEEFEFKPITDGLGFHRNQKPLSNTASNPAPVSATNQIVTASTEKEILFSTPLPSKKSKSTNDSYTEQTNFNDRTTLSQTQTHDIVDEILKNIETSKQKNQPQFLHSKSPEARIISSKIEPVYKPSGPLMTAMLLDQMLVTASTLLFLVALLAITKIDLLQNIKNPDEYGAVYLSLFLLFSSVSFIYYVVFRAFLGYTPGEWAYDQKIQIRGGRIDFFTLTKIALRSVIIFVSGGLILPLISWVMDKDILGSFLDLPLVRRK